MNPNRRRLGKRAWMGKKALGILAIFAAGLALALGGCGGGYGGDDNKGGGGTTTGQTGYGY
jgi:hypothetical protein